MPKTAFRRAARSAIGASLVVLLLAMSIVPTDAGARGVSPYLPLNISPDMERNIERVLVLANQPILRRPIPVALVLDALPKACQRDADLCEVVKGHLESYLRSYGVTSLRAQLAYAKGSSHVAIPNQHGLTVDSTWQVNASAYLQPADYFILNGGGIATGMRATPAGSFASLGFNWAQLDVGFRDHWFSPLNDSGLMSTEAPTMPSASLSNTEPMTPLGVTYEVFLAELSRQEDIAYFDSTKSGRPRLADLQLGFEPAAGYALGVNRLFQYGGGARGGTGVSEFLDALYKNSNKPDVLGQSREFGNQEAALSSSLIFPGRSPFAIHMQYGGEDNAYGGSYRLGDTVFTLGIDLPVLFERFDWSYEISEWQDLWYIHHH